MLDDRDDIEYPLLPRTPVSGKRRRRASDVVNTNGIGFYGMAAMELHSTPNRTVGETEGETSVDTPSSVFASTPNTSGIWLKTPTSSSSRAFDTSDNDNLSEDNFHSAWNHELLNVVRPPTLIDAERYNMHHKKRGKCIVFNNVNFENGFECRVGSDEDAARIKSTFNNLGFNVEICKDYKHSQILDKVSALSQEDHSDADCIAIFVLTHGVINDFISARDVLYKADSIWKPFIANRCTSLAGKPKLFFYQACRGRNLDGGIEMSQIEADVTDSTITASYKIPSHADFLIAHSTVDGFFSWRNPAEGTWYIQSLCDAIDEHASSLDLGKILTITSRKVATEYSSNHIDPTQNDQKQVPSVTSMLIRDVFFTPKI